MLSRTLYWKPNLTLFALALYLLLTLWCWRTGVLTNRWHDADYRRLVIGALVTLLVLWHLRAGIYEGLSLHFLGITAITLMFGWRSALCLLSVPQLLLVGLEPSQWPQLTALLWLGIVLPVMTAYGWLTLCHNLLPRNLWVFVFISAFANGAVVFIVRTLALGLWYQNQYDWSTIVDNYLILIPLFLVPEAMLNGFTVVLLVVYKPEWLATWRERQYLTQKDKS